MVTIDVDPDVTPYYLMSDSNVRIECDDHKLSSHVYVDKLI